MKQTKTKEKKSAVKDIKVKTQVSAEDMGRIEATGPYEPASPEEVAETTIIVNPDADSMESRG